MILSVNNCIVSKGGKTRPQMIPSQSTPWIRHHLVSAPGITSTGITGLATFAKLNHRVTMVRAHSFSFTPTLL